MAKIETMQQLRERVLQSIDDLENGKISIEQAACISKMSETVISGLKSEMQYAILTKTEPSIPFYSRNNALLIEGKDIKSLT